MQKQSGRSDLDFQQANKAADAVAQDVPLEFWASSYNPRLRTRLQKAGNIRDASPSKALRMVMFLLHTWDGTFVTLRPWDHTCRDYLLRSCQLVICHTNMVLATSRESFIWIGDWCLWHCEQVVVIRQHPPLTKFQRTSKNYHKLCFTIATFSAMVKTILSSKFTLSGTTIRRLPTWIFLVVRW